MATKAETNESSNLTADLKRLQSIADWFDSREEVDIEAALEKVKEATELLRSSKKRLGDIENEFAEIKKNFESSDE